LAQIYLDPCSSNKTKATATALTVAGIVGVGGGTVAAIVKRGKKAPKSGTVFDSIKATQPALKGTSIPKSFELSAGSSKFWVHPNATKHMSEYLTRNGLSPSSSILFCFRWNRTLTL